MTGDNKIPAVNPNEITLTAEDKEFALLMAEAKKLGRKYELALHAQYRRQTNQSEA